MNKSNEMKTINWNVVIGGEAFWEFQRKQNFSNHKLVIEIARHTINYPLISFIFIRPEATLDHYLKADFI